MIQAMLNYKAWADQELMNCLNDHQASLPPEVLAKAMRLMNHIHVVDQIFLAHLQGQAHDFSTTNTEDTPSAEALIWQMGEVNQRLMTEAERLQGGNTDRMAFRFTDGDAGAMTRDEMLSHVCLHSTYHRGQVGQMLKDLGVAPPRELLTRKLHTEEPARRQPV